MPSPVRSRTNHYRGINAHLHSALQQHSGAWEGFHTMHIGDLAKSLQAQLYPLGYLVDVQQSLQLRHQDLPAGKPKSDISVYDMQPAQRRHKPPAQMPAAPHELVLALPDILEDSEDAAEYMALAVYPFSAEGDARGAPVAWIEFLSPSNKPGGSDYRHYHRKRLKLIDAGIVFVEIDYLHESPPTLTRLAYLTPPSLDTAFPYRFIVIDPRPQVNSGSAHIYQFAVDDPLPEIDLPLSGSDVVRFDFYAPYQRTFEEMFYGLKYVDYSTLPANFDRYNAADQLRILRRMLTVIDAAHKGHDLARAPLPLINAPDTVAAALARLADLTTGEVSP